MTLPIIRIISLHLFAPCPFPAPNVIFLCADIAAYFWEQFRKPVLRQLSDALRGTDVKTTREWREERCGCTGREETKKSLLQRPEGGSADKTFSPSVTATLA